MLHDDAVSCHHHSNVLNQKQPKNDQHRHLTIYCRVDLNDNGQGGTGGSIPMWFYVRNIGKIAAMAIDRMRTALIQEEEEREQREQQQREPHVGNNSCPAVSTTTTTTSAAAAAAATSTTKGGP
jgi:hypothetical protein